MVSFRQKFATAIRALVMETYGSCPRTQNPNPKPLSKRHAVSFFEKKKALKQAGRRMCKTPPVMSAIASSNAALALLLRVR